MLLLIAICIDASHAASVKFYDGVARINARSPDGSPIEIMVSTTKYSPSFPYRAGYEWGADTTPSNPSPAYPKSVITSVDVTVGKVKILIPLSAYSDLANPNTLTFETTSNGFRLIVVGGDAGGAYKAELYFEGKYIKRRKVASAEFPTEAWEETVYTFNTGPK
jgi:hypothetical protein